MRSHSKTLAILFLVVTSVASGGSTDHLVLSFRASGQGMTWTWTQDYLVLLRSDGTLVYTGLDGSHPTFYVRSVSADQLSTATEDGRRIHGKTIRLAKPGFTDCHLNLEIFDYDTGEKFVALGVPCNLSGLPREVTHLICTVDSLANDGKGISSVSICKGIGGADREYP
jgi:hypothetical protein